MKALQFDAETHTYSVDGVILPSVTQVLEDVGIIDYRFLPDETRESALKRGSDVHTLTQFDDEGDLLEESVSAGLRGYLEAWRKFRSEHPVGLLPLTLNEHRGYHDYGFAGTLDRLFGGRYLVDIKTNQTPWWVRIQLAAYQAIIEPEYSGLHRMAVELHNDGTYSASIMRAAGWRDDFGTFVAALRVYREKRVKGRR
jgi:hypothetical protein